MLIVCVGNFRISLSIAVFISEQNKIKIYLYNVFAVFVYISIEKNNTKQKLHHLLSIPKPR
jgi:hypothetical protein